MATRTWTSQEISGGEIKWVAAIVAGLVGTLGFGLLFHAIGQTGLMAMVIPAMYGIQGPSLAIGWALHLFHGAVLGLVYAGVCSFGPLREHAGRLTGGIALGAGYGVVTTVVLAGIVLPVWLSTVGFPNPPALLSISTPGLVGHLVYGVLLGALYPAIGTRL